MGPQDPFRATATSISSLAIMDRTPRPRRRNTVSVDRLRRSSTLQDHVKVLTLNMPTDYGKSVQMIKLRQSFESFVDATSPSSDMTKMNDKDGTATSDGSASKTGPGHDILLSIPHAELVELQPFESSWYAMILIDNSAIQAVDAFISAGQKHYKETHMNGAFVSPFSESAAREQPFAHVQVKISEFCGKLLHTTFADPKGEVLFRPGDDMLSLKPKELLGPCSVTIHLAGYWHDETKQGPLLYLTNVSMLDASKVGEPCGSEEVEELEPPPPPLSLPPSVHEMLKSPGGTVKAGRRLSLTPPPVDKADPTQDHGESTSDLLSGEFRFSPMEDEHVSSPHKATSPRLEQLKIEARMGDLTVPPTKPPKSYVRRKLNLTTKAKRRSHETP